jgi:hypothetical protein
MIICMLWTGVILANMQGAAEGNHTLHMARDVPHSSSRSTASTGGLPVLEGNSGGFGSDVTCIC